MPKIAINIVTWNSKLYLENALQSLTEQTFKDFNILIVDNASSDGTIDWLREYYPQIKVVRNANNLGFAKGHNQAISFTQSDYVLVMNPDVIITENYLAQLVEFMDANAQAGSTTGKIYKLTSRPEVLEKESFTRIIDTLGIKGSKSRRFDNIAEGEADSGQFNQIQEIFGVGGHLALYRRQALEDIKIDGEYFDQDFHSYKEDIDLAWRLRWCGWQSFMIPTAIAYHHRTAAGKEQAGNLEIIKQRQEKPSYTYKVSYRNHLCLLVKNEQNFWQDFLIIIWYELKKFVYILLFEQKTLKGLVEFFKLLSKMRVKRQVIISSAKIKKQDMRKWFK